MIRSNVRLPIVSHRALVSVQQYVWETQCHILTLLISCSQVAASIVAEDTNAGMTVFVAEITSMCGLRCDGIAAL